MNIKHILMMVVLLSSASAQADFIETDWNNTGDALATLDTETGIEWLDLTQTKGMSINRAEGLTGAGGIYEGWRLPTRNEVTQMMVSAFPSEAFKVQGSGGWYSNSATVHDEAIAFMALFGYSGRDGYYDYSRGFLKTTLTRSTV